MFHPTSRKAKTVRFSNEDTFNINKANFIALLSSYSPEAETQLTGFFNTEIAPFKTVIIEGYQPVSYFEAIICSAIIACAVSNNLKALNHLKELEPNLREYAQTVKTQAQRISREDRGPFGISTAEYRDGGWSAAYDKLVDLAEYNPSEDASEEFARDFDDLLAQPMFPCGRK